MGYRDTDDGLKIFGWTPVELDMGGGQSRIWIKRNEQMLADPTPGGGFRARYGTGCEITFGTTELDALYKAADITEARGVRA